MSRNVRKCSIGHVHPAKIQTSPRIRNLITLRKHAYSNNTESFTTKTKKISEKKSDILHMPAQNIDCMYSLEPPRRGGSNAYLQSMFLS